MDVRTVPMHMARNSSVPLSDGGFSTPSTHSSTNAGQWSDTSKTLIESSPELSPEMPPPSSTGFARKKMRQGTHSCTECRRRKIKCTSRGDTSKSCQECFIRGLKCVDQRHGVERVEKDVDPVASTKQNNAHLQRRVEELEGMLKDVMERLPQHLAQRKYNNRAREVHVEECSPARPELDYLSPAPTLTDRSVVSDGGSSDREEVTARPFSSSNVFGGEDVSVKDGSSAQLQMGAKTRNLTSELKMLLPPIQSLERIFTIPLGRDLVARTRFTDTDEQMDAKKLPYTIHNSQNPLTVAKGLLMVGTCMHHLPKNNYEFKQMFKNINQQEVIERYSTVIEHRIMANEEFAITVDGVECGYLLAELHVTAGRPRRAWLAIRRSLSHSQMLGLHQMMNSPAKTQKQEDDRKRKSGAWSALAWKDVLLSLFLGLPHSTPDAFVVPQLQKIGKWLQWGDTMMYGIELTSVMVQIVARNQDPEQMTYTNTLRIDQELETIARSRQGEWWDYCKPEYEHADTLVRVGHIFAYVMHNLTRMLLHMPFMLKSYQEPRFQYSLVATLESARDLITCYQTVKSSPETDWSACKVLDFWAFISAVILVLNLVGTPTSNAPLQSPQQDATDWKTIEACIATLSAASADPGGFVCQQCAQTLTLLADVRHGPMAKAVRVSIPFFGVITIGEGQHFEQAPETNPAAQLTGATITETHAPASIITPPQAPSDPTLPIDSAYTISGRKRSRDEYVSDARAPDLDFGFMRFDNMYGMPPPETSDAPILNPTLAAENLTGGYHNEAAMDWSYWTMVDLDNDWKWDNF